MIQRSGLSFSRSIAMGLVAFAAAARAPVVAQPPTRIPIIAELFTSEGCSSCPAADDLLAQLLAGQSLQGVEVIGLSEHVDYWNHDGWKDPFSSAKFTERQEQYGR